jgi:hypothetical protein
MDQAADDLELAAHPARVGADRPEDLVTEADDAGELRHLVAVVTRHEPVRRTVGSDAVEDRVEANVLLAGQVPVEARALEDDPDPAADRARLADDVEPVDARHPRGRREGGGQDGDRRRLPGAVRTEEREELAGAHVEADAVHRVAVGLPVALDESLDLDHCGSGAVDAIGASLVG